MWTKIKGLGFRPVFKQLNQNHSFFLNRLFITRYGRAIFVRQLINATAEDSIRTSILPTVTAKRLKTSLRQLNQEPLVEEVAMYQSHIVVGWRAIFDRHAKMHRGWRLQSELGVSIFHRRLALDDA